MKITNTTDLDTEQLKAITKLLTKGMTRKLSRVIFRKCKRQFSGVYKYGWFTKPTIIVRLGDCTYPFTMNAWHNKYYPRYEIRDKFELAIAILAHEVYHFKAHFQKNRRNTQIRAERFAMKTLKQFRKKYLEDN